MNLEISNMLHKFYVLQGLISNGYWSEEYQAFKGYLFATKYNNTVDNGKLSLGLSDALNVEDCQIVEIYTKKKG